MPYLYAERHGPDFWGEPFNSLSNLAFLVAAWAYSQLLKGKRTALQNALMGLTALVGVGSFLYHSLAMPWARILDEGPILGFQLTYFWAYLRQLPRWSPLPTAGVLTGLALSSWTGSRIPFFNGLWGYAPALILVAILGIYHLRTRKNEPWILVGATGVLLLGIGFRTVDFASWLPMGTHFLWHLADAVVVYLGLRALAKNGA